MDIPAPLGNEDAADAITPPRPGARVSDRVPLGQRLLAITIRGVDVLLRRWYGVREFTADPACLIRLARARADREVRLADGTVIAQGEEVLILHIWNEQVPRFRLRSGPDLGWAVDIRHRLLHSFEQLARHLASDAETAHITGIHACVAFGSRRRRWQIRRAAERFGLELIEDTNRVKGRHAKGLHERGEDVLIWVLTRAFNPAALRRQPFWRDRTELWISRRTLLGRYL